jgi:hypothetical protein
MLGRLNGAAGGTARSVIWDVGMVPELGGFAGPDGFLLVLVVRLTETLGVFIEPAGRRIDPLCFLHEPMDLLIVLPRFGRLRSSEPGRPMLWICQVSSSDQSDKSIQATLTGLSELGTSNCSVFAPIDCQI